MRHYLHPVLGRLERTLGPDCEPWVGFLILYIKIWLVFFMFAMVKAIVPRYRYDQLMRIGWKIFLPTTLVAVAVVGGHVAYFGR